MFFLFIIILNNRIFFIIGSTIFSVNEITQILNDWCEAVNIRDVNGCTPLHYAGTLLLMES